jgi:hypothetical protein
MTDDLKTGQHRNPGSDPGFFTTAYFHDRAGIASEITDSGLRLRDLLPIEGPLHWAPGIPGPAQRPRQAAAHPRQKGCGVPAVIASRQDCAMLAGRPFLVCAGGP